MYKIFLAIGFLFLLACSSKETLTHSFSNERWVYSDSVRLTYHNASPQLRKMSIGMNLTQDYPFRNIYLIARIQTPSGKSVSNMPNFYFSDSLGYFSIKKSGNVYPFETVLNPAIFLDETGDYQFILKQYMRKDTLLGIQNIQLFFEPSDSTS